MTANGLIQPNLNQPFQYLPLASILFYRNHLDEEFKLFKKVKIKHQIIFKIVLRCLKKEPTSRFNWQLFKLMH